jgi:hypothetical protein
MGPQPYGEGLVSVVLPQSAPRHGSGYIDVHTEGPQISTAAILG